MTESSSQRVQAVLENEGAQFPVVLTTYKVTRDGSRLSNRTNNYHCQKSKENLEEYTILNTVNGR